MKKIFTKILSLLTVSVASLLPATGLFAPKTVAQTVTAGAEGVSSLCSATTADYAALSHENTLYAYSEQDGIWQEYEHTQPITQLHFGGQSTVYFLDTTFSLFTLNLSAFTEGTVAQTTGVSCSSFTIDGENLYYSNLAGNEVFYYQASLRDLSQVTQSYALKAIPSSPSFADGELYAIDGYDHLYRLASAAKNSEEIARLPAGTEEIARLPAGTKEMRVVGDSFFCIADDGFFVYSLPELKEKTNAALCTPIFQDAGSFSALSADGNAVHLLKENVPYAYSLSTGAFGVADGAFARPCTSALPTGNLKTDIENGTAELTVVQTLPDSLLIAVDLEGATETLPVLSVLRMPSLIALKVAETEYYALLSYQESAETGYKTYLVDKRNIDPVVTTYTAYESPKTGYTTSGVGLYKYPQMNLPTIATLPRGAQLTLRGEVVGLSREYYAVEHEGKIGYIPKTYVTDNAYPVEQTETVLLGDKDKTDSIWRLGYILLGSAAICVLVDFLILRKKED